MPEVPTPGKKLQSLPSTGFPGSRDGAPHAGWSCSSLLPAMSLVPSSLTAIVGSFCLFVGNTAVLSDVGDPATCGLLACRSMTVGLAPETATAAIPTTGASATRRLTHTRERLTRTR